MNNIQHSNINNVEEKVKKKPEPTAKNQRLGGPVKHCLKDSPPDDMPPLPPPKKS